MQIGLTTVSVRHEGDIDATCLVFKGVLLINVASG